MEDRMEVNILAFKLRVVNIKKRAIARFVHPLIDVLFLKHYQYSGYSTRTDGFASILETNTDYSLIIEDHALCLFDTEDKDVRVIGDLWHPLVVTAGALLNTQTSGISKIAKSVIIPLADFGVSVYCLSTYKTDYVLIREGDMKTACEVLARDFRITREESLLSQEIIVDPQNIRQRSDSGEKRSRQITHSLTCLPNTFCITSMDRESIKSQALTLIDLIFYTHDPSDEGDVFLSLSIIDDDVSLIVDSKVLSRFPPNVLYNTREYWHMVQIGDMPEGLGFAQAGVVAQISDPIASALISEYYISSYYYGHTLVPAEHFDAVKQLLDRRKKSQNELDLEM